MTVTRIGFHNTNDNRMDETEFDTADTNEALMLFEDFCNENGFGRVNVEYIETEVE